MTRCVKFRAWDMAGKYMVQWEGMWGLTRVETPDGIAVHIAAGDQCYLMPEDIHLMQFTGILDKNGKEIWEGDVIEDESGTAAVRWSKHMAAWVIKDCPNGDDLLLSEYADTLAVIGNIYEPQ